MNATVNTETLGFQSEVRQLLDLVINSLYSNREIFLRELVSNASDAIEKLRFRALSNHDMFGGDSDLAIDIDFDAEARTLTVRDNGIGMSREDMVNLLGTIAKSGTREFFGSLSGDARTDSQLIGQFGVGFYAAFIVADKVAVSSRRADLPAEAGARWSSEGRGEFTIEDQARVARGTEIVLHLKEDAGEFADGWRLRGLIKKYSDHISTPIRMPGTDKEKPEREIVNSATALWLRAKQDIADDEYKAFYQHVSHDYQEPLAWLHSKVEGKLEYTTLFYLPGHAPFDLYDRDARHGVKLYVQRVFIMDDAEQMLPRYLRFVRGIVDTRDLPLNISREILQRNKVLDTIRAASVKKILGLVEGLDATAFATFWKEFGRVLKEGVIEDHGNQERIAKLLRFASTHDDDAAQNVALADYVARMPEGQKSIYYLTAENLGTARSSPHLEVFRARGIEVLLLSEPVDEWLVQHLTSFEGKALKSVTHGALDLPDADAEDKQDENQPEPEIATRLAAVLKDRVKAVRASRRLTASASCLVADEFDMGMNLQRILKAAGQDVPAAQRILEINVEHPLLQRLAKEGDHARFDDLALLVYEQAVVAEGGRLDDAAGFVRRINQLLLAPAQAS
jgi:molecular chaperone HtpG